MTTLDSFIWGSAPAIPITYTYEYRRSGGDMQYRIGFVIGVPAGEGSFGYSIGATVQCDSVVVGCALKAASIPLWNAERYGSTDWITIPNKLSGTTQLKITLTTDAPRGSDSRSYTLPVTAASSDMAVPDMILGDQGAIRISKTAAAYTHTIVCAVGEENYTLCSKSGLTTVYWTPPVSIARQVTDDTEVLAEYTITTFDGDTAVGSRRRYATLYVPATVVPTVSVTRTLVNDHSTVAAWGIALRGYSRCHYTITAVGAQDADIESYRTVLEGRIYTGAEFTGNILQTAGELSSTVAVTDSRGRSAVVELAKLQVIEYTPPALTAASAERCDAGGTAKTDGTYIKCICAATCAAVGGRNSVTCRVRWRSAGGSWSSYTTLTDTTLIGGFSACNAYEVELSAVDSLGEVSAVKQMVPPDKVTLQLRPGGNGAALGKRSEKENTLECAWDAEFLGDVLIGGALQVGNCSLLDWAHPVGSVYLSADVGADPETLFGGTWQALSTVQNLYAWKRTA